MLIKINRKNTFDTLRITNINVSIKYFVKINIIVIIIKTYYILYFFKLKL